MGLMTATLIGLGVATAATQVYAGREQAKQIKSQAEFNAKVYEQQAGMISEQKKLEAQQYNRRIARARATGIAATAGRGLLLSGSPLATIIDTETQMLMDKAIGQYNLEVQRRYILSGAEQYRYSGVMGAKTAKMRGYTNAFSTLLGTGLSAATRFPTGTKEATRAT